MSAPALQCLDDNLNKVWGCNLLGNGLFPERKSLTERKPFRLGLSKESYSGLRRIYLIFDGNITSFPLIGDEIVLQAKRLFVELM